MTIRQSSRIGVPPTKRQDDGEKTIQKIRLNSAIKVTNQHFCRKIHDFQYQQQTEFLSSCRFPNGLMFAKQVRRNVKHVAEASLKVYQTRWIYWYQIASQRYILRPELKKKLI